MRYNKTMEAKVINKTRLDFKLIVRGNFLSNRFMTILYGILSLIFVYMVINGVIYYQRTNDPELFMQLIFEVCMLVFSLAVAFLWPLLKALYLKHKINKHYHTDHQDIEYYFNDLNMRIVNELEGTNTKVEYRDIYRIYRSKKLMVITLRKNYLIIDLDGFLKPNDEEKVTAYLKRAKKL